MPLRVGILLTIFVPNERFGSCLIVLGAFFFPIDPPFLPPFQTPFQPFLPPLSDRQSLSFVTWLGLIVVGKKFFFRKS